MHLQHFELELDPPDELDPHDPLDPLDELEGMITKIFFFILPLDPPELHPHELPLEPPLLELPLEQLLEPPDEHPQPNEFENFPNT